MKSILTKTRTLGAIILVVILSISLTSILYFSNALGQQNTCSTTSLSSTSLFIENQSGTFGAVFVMDKGYKATLCLTYTYSASSVENGPAKSGPYAGEVFKANQANGLLPTSLVTSKSNPENYTVPVHNETVIYTIATSDNASGFYYLGFSLQCRPTALAVGYTSSQINYSDFRGYLGFVSCPFAQIAKIQVSGFSGLHMMYVQRNCTIDEVAPQFC